MIDPSLIFALISNAFEIFASSYSLYKSTKFTYLKFIKREISEREDRILLYISLAVILILFFRYFIFPGFIISDCFAYLYLTFNIYGTLGMLGLKNTEKCQYSLLTSLSPLILFIIVTVIFRPSFLIVSPLVFLTRIFFNNLIDELCIKRMSWIHQYLPYQYLPEYKAEDLQLVLNSIKAITFASYVITGTLHVAAIPFLTKIMIQARNTK